MTTTKNSDSDSIESNDKSTKNNFKMIRDESETVKNCKNNSKNRSVNKSKNKSKNNSKNNGRKNNGDKDNNHNDEDISSGSSSNSNNNNDNEKNDSNSSNSNNNNANDIKVNKCNSTSLLFVNDSSRPKISCDFSMQLNEKSKDICNYSYRELLNCDYKLKLLEDDKDSLVEMSASEDEDDTDFGRVVNGEFREIDNTSDLTSSPPPPHLSHSNCSSPITTDSTHNSLLSLNSTVSQQAESKFDHLTFEPAIGCCRLCCPNIQNTAQNYNHQNQLIPHYPPTVSSIRNAVSHLTRLDDFNVVKLSHGFFSQVFKVVHFGTKRILVLKMNKNAGNRGNALKEIELLNKLNHENIVAFMGTVVHEGALHPLLEYINGGTLEQLIKQYYNSEENLANQSFYCTTRLNVISPKVHRLENADMTFVKLMQDVARGMQYLHNKSYIHRDLASKNIFIQKLPFDCLHNHTIDCDCCETCLAEEFDDRRLVAVIGDFGFATHEPEPGQVLSTVGSPYWLAPECLKNFWYNHKCDVYSFGIICCELNWRIPADPDFLPRSNDFSVDFTKLNYKRDTLLGRVAQLACRANPQERPEFGALRSMLEVSQVKLTTAAATKTALSDGNNNRLFNYLNKLDQLDVTKRVSVAPILEDNHTSNDRGLPLHTETAAFVDDDDDDDDDAGSTNNDASIILAFQPEMRDKNKQCLNSTLEAIKEKSNQTQTRPIERLLMNNEKFRMAVENDIFDQHLLRRHLSSISQSSPICSCSDFKSCSQSSIVFSSSSNNIDQVKDFSDYHYLHQHHHNNNGSSDNHHHHYHHHHHPYLHYHQQIQQQNK